MHVDATGNGQVDAPANAVPKRKLLYYLVAHVEATVEWQSQLPVYIEAVPAVGTPFHTQDNSEVPKEADSLRFRV